MIMKKINKNLSTLNHGFKNLDSLFEYKFPQRKIIKELSKSEIKKIDKKYDYTFLFFFKRKVILIIEKLISVFLGDSFTLIKSRSLYRVKKKYDQLAGLYIDNFTKGDAKSVIELPNNKIVQIKGNIKDYHSECLSKIIIKTKSKSILDAGAGEFTQFYLLKKKLINRNYKLHKDAGLDLSFNRLYKGKKFLKQNKLKIDYVIQADASKIPFNDSSFDLIYTCHCLEQIPKLFIKSVQEMVRVSKKFVILIEPSYELSNNTTKKRIFVKNYVRITDKVLSEIKGVSNIFRKKLPIREYLNGAEMVIIEKSIKFNNYKREEIKLISPKSQKLLFFNKRKKTFETKNKKEKFLLDKGIIRFI